MAVADECFEFVGVGVVDGFTAEVGFEDLINDEFLKDGDIEIAPDGCFVGHVVGERVFVESEDVGFATFGVIDAHGVVFVFGEFFGEDGEAVAGVIGGAECEAVVVVDEFFELGESEVL